VLYDATPAARARRLSEAMANAGLRKADLARRCGASAQSVGEWLKTGRIAADRLPAISKAVGRSPEWLATGLEPASLALAEKFQALSHDDQLTVEKITDALLCQGGISGTKPGA
jgi:transcriptional regulator with XRE-family HTH domain